MVAQVASLRSAMVSTDFALPVTRYAQSGDLNIAYQVMGEGPIDIVLVPGAITHVECLHELPGYTTFLRRVAAFARVVTFDKRGQGLSDRVAHIPSLEERMDDLRAIMDAIGSRQAFLIGFSGGSAMSILFAATYPDRVSGLVLFGGFDRFDWITAEQVEQAIRERLAAWGTGIFVKRVVSAQHPVSAETMEIFGKLERLSASPGAYKAIMLMNAAIDVRSILPAIRVSTLVLHRKTDAVVPVEKGRELATFIPGAKYIEYPEGDHAFCVGDTEALLGDIEEFVTGRRDHTVGEHERVLTTVLFTDIVDSTRSAWKLGDQKWRRRLDEHDRLANQMVQRHRGRLVKTTGDGILATFDGPARAVRCALAFSAAAKDIGIPLRAGLHTGEIEMRGRDVSGIAVHAASRVMGYSLADEVMVSRVVTDLVAGAGLHFSERGSHELKGLPGKWDLFAASL
jgi:class 3 adenylate cyclase/predicted esterase